MTIHSLLKAQRSSDKIKEKPNRHCHSYRLDHIDRQVRRIFRHRSLLRTAAPSPSEVQEGSSHLAT